MVPEQTVLEGEHEMAIATFRVVLGWILHQPTPHGDPEPGGEVGHGGPIGPVVGHQKKAAARSDPLLDGRTLHRRVRRAVVRIIAAPGKREHHNGNPSEVW